MKKHTLFLVAVFFVFHCGQKLPGNIIATIKNEGITVDAFLSSRYSLGIAEKPNDYIEKNVIDFLEEKTIITDAREKKMDKHKAVRNQVKKETEKLAIAQYYQKNIIDYILTEEILRDAYSKIQIDYILQVILISFSGKEKKRSKETSFALAQSIFEGAKSGKNFISLVKKHSEYIRKDPGAPSGVWNWGLMEPSFQSVVPKLVAGEIAGPLTTRMGYYVIKLIEKKSAVYNSYDIEKPRLYRLLSKTYRNEIMEHEKNVDQQIKTKHMLKINERNIKKLLDEIQKNQEKHIDRNIPQLAISDLLKKFNHISPLAVFHGGNKITPVWLDNTFSAGSDFKMHEVLKNFSSIVSSIEKQLIKIFMAKDANISNSKNNLEEKNKILDNALFMHYNKTVFGADIIINENELQRYYKKHPTQYMTKDLVEVREILVSDSVLAFDLRLRLDGGENFATLASLFTKRSRAAQNGGLLPPIARGEYGNLGNLAFYASIGDLVGPFRIGKNKWSLFLKTKEKPSERISFEKAKNRVQNTIKKEKLKKRRKEILETLFHKYNVKINTKLIHSGLLKINYQGKIFEKSVQ